MRPDDNYAACREGCGCCVDSMTDPEEQEEEDE